MSENKNQSCGAGDGSSCSSCASGGSGGSCSAAGASQRPEEEAVRRRLARVRHKLVVLSGKGGVGKSTVAVNLAVALSARGQRVGLLDADIHGPSIPTMVRADVEAGGTPEGSLEPARAGALKMISIGYLLRDSDEALIWRGPMKMSVLRQFLGDVEWGELDWLIIDSPPGTGDEPLSICQLIDDLDGAVVVTTPQAVAAIDVRKSITFCRALELPVLGVIENMSGFVCPSCGELTEVFGSGAGEAIARDFGVPLLAKIPMDPALRVACDDGMPFIAQNRDSQAARALAVDALLEQIPADGTAAPAGAAGTGGGELLRLAVPVAEGKLSMHFGHCAEFALIDADSGTGEIRGREDVPAPEHEPGLLPRWLAEKGVQAVIAGGMGQRAQQLFRDQGIQVLTGAPSEDPETLVRAYLAGTLETGDNVCDH